MFSIILIVLAIFILLHFEAERNKVIYSAPTIEQVKEFIAANSINAVAMKDAPDFTIVLFSNKTSWGHYILYQDQYGKLYNSWVKANGSIQDNPVSLGGVASGKTPFVTIIINDEEILKNASETEVTFRDGTIINEEIDGKGTVVLKNNENIEKPVTYRKLIIYDKNKQILYEH